MIEELLAFLPLFQPAPDDSTLYIGLFNPWLVGAAIFVVMAGVFAVFSALNFSRSNANAIKSLALFEATLGFVLGLCLWIMHFIGLIGYILPVPVAYDPSLTAVSVLPALLGGVAALGLLARHPPRAPIPTLLLAGGCLALGMLLTHVAGISAIDLAGMVKADAADVLAWGSGSWFMASLALAVPGQLQRWLGAHRSTALWLSSLLSGALLYAIHRCGMEITHFMTNPQADMVVEGYDPEWLALVVMGIAALLGTVIWLLFMRSFLRQIERSNVLLHQALELTHSGFWEYEPHSQALLLSEQSARLFGRAYGRDTERWAWKEWLTGVSRVDARLAQQCQDQLRQLLDGKEERVKWTFPYQAQEQQAPIWLNCVGTVFHDHAPHLKRFYFAIQDVTDEYLLKEALKTSKEIADDANKTKGEFLANMSHEIRTPMNAILGLTELALRQPMTPKLNDYLGKVQLAAKNLLGIINDILDLSKVESGKMELEITDFNLDDVLDNLSTVLASSIEEKGLELLFDRKPDVAIALKGDPLRLGQVLLNLCGNARKFTERGSIVVRVSTTERQERTTRLLFEIVDSGIGMTPQQVSRLFQPFSQADASTTRKYGGTGLGLVISKQLVELMGGQIGVRSSPGAGSTFYFEIPLECADDSKESPLLNQRLQGMKVLVVDDNPQVRDILSAHLKHFRCQVQACESADEALPLVARSDSNSPFELILMDYRMPGTDGLTAARQIRHEMGLTKVPAIILVTAASHFDGHDERTIKDAVNEVLNKPVNASMLFDAIMNVLGFESSITHRPAQRKNADTDELGRLRGARILLVEDNPINQEVATEFLSQAGMSVTVAHHGQQALAILTQQAFDLVLMDVQMPVMDGYTATREIRKNPLWDGLPVIAMTANVMAQDRKMAAEAGMNDHVAKPIVMAQLQSVLLKWIKDIAPDRMEHESTRPAQETVEPEGFLPEGCEVLDVAGALQMLGGHRKLLRKLLLDFVIGHDSDAQALAQCIDQGKFEEAERLAHTMKGLAGMLCAHALQNSSQALESEFRKNSAAPASALIEAWQADLESVLSHLKAWKDTPSTLAETHPPIEAQSRQGLIGQLKTLLQAFDPAASELAQQLAQGDEEHRQVWQTLKQQASDFDFEGALTTLDHLGIAK